MLHWSPSWVPATEKPTKWHAWCHDVRWYSTSFLGSLSCLSLTLVRTCLHSIKFYPSWFNVVICSIIVVRSDLMDWTKLKCQADQSCLKIERKPKEMLLTNPSRSKHAVWLPWSFHLRWKHILRFMCYISSWSSPHAFFLLLGRVFWDKNLETIKNNFESRLIIQPCSPNSSSPLAGSKGSNKSLQVTIIWLSATIIIYID